MRRLFIIATMILAAVSCSIKEDRMPCPAYIHPMVTEFPDDGNVLVTVKKDGGMIFQELMTREEFENPDFEVKVSRGYVTVAVTTGVNAMVLKSSDVLSTDRVSEADRLSSYVEDFYVVEERQDVSAKVEKQHSLVYFDILGDTDNSRLVIGGDWAGMNAYTMDAVRGPYSVNITEDMKVGDEYVFCMARQGDYSMKLYLYGEKNMREIKIGELMQRAGYLIDNDVLADVHVTIDLSKGIISIRIGDWGEIVQFNIVTI